MQTIKHKHDTGTFAQAVWGCGLVVLVLLGICGTLYKLLAPGGWIAGMLGNGFSGGVAVIGLLIVFAVTGRIVRTWTSNRQQSNAADLIVYVFAAAGALYVYQYWSRGVF